MTIIEYIKAIAMLCAVQGAGKGYASDINTVQRGCHAFYAECLPTYYSSEFPEKWRACAIKREKENK